MQCTHGIDLEVMCKECMVLSQRKLLGIHEAPPAPVQTKAAAPLTLERLEELSIRAGGGTNWGENDSLDLMEFARLVVHEIRSGSVLPAPQEAPAVLFDAGKPIGWVTNCPFCLRSLHLTLQQTD